MKSSWYACYTIKLFGIIQIFHWVLIFRFKPIMMSMVRGDSTGSCRRGDAQLNNCDHSPKANSSH